MKNNKKKLRSVISLFIAFCLLLGFVHRKTIFQCGNPIPYVAKMITLNGDKHYAKVFKDKDIYVTKHNDYKEFEKYIEDKYDVTLYEHIGVSYTYVSDKYKVVLTPEMYWSKYDVWKITIE
ncbi:MAG: hypothetical protein RR891_10410 [Clostridium sp.]|uniref:hypothetical protein n=1 Tax=Clostridium sp. TaxID=1506 RepID=UPI00305D78D7